MLKTEEKVPTLYDALCADPGFFTRHEIDTLDGQLGLDDIQEGFLMNKRQFAFWANIMRPYSERSYGMWSFQFHPLSGHMLEKKVSGNNVTKTLAFTHKWSAFRWDANRQFLIDWIYFSNMGFDYIAVCKLNAETILEYFEVNYNDQGYIVTSRNHIKSENEWTCNFFVGWDAKNQKRVYLWTHIGGGRLYSEDCTRPYEIRNHDKMPSIPPEETRAILCLVRETGGDDNLLAPDYLPRDLFGLIVRMFK